MIENYTLFYIQPKISINISLNFNNLENDFVYPNLIYFEFTPKIVGINLQ